MTEQPYKKISFDWLITHGDKPTAFDYPERGSEDWTKIPMPAELGEGKFRRVNMALGMTLAIASAEFTDQALGRLLRVSDISVELKEPTLQAMITRGLHGTLEDFPNAAQTSNTLALSQGIDVFRYSEGYQHVVSFDGSFNGSLHLLTMGQSMLIQLLGEIATEKLLTALNISQSPSLTSRAIPLHVSTHLVDAYNNALSPSSQTLFCQAKALEYLSALLDHCCGDRIFNVKRNSKSKKRANDIHDELIHSEGKPPTLDELAVRHGRSAKLLNEEFNQEYGQSIYSFLMDHRLVQAHAALKSSDTPIKSLAALLGYSHTSNFTTAFKRKFGYSPGSLRKSNED